MKKSLIAIFKRHRKVITYVFFGGISALIEFLIFLIADVFLCIYLAAFLSFCCGLIASFLFNKLVVFRSRTKGCLDFSNEAARFVILGAINSQISSFMTLGLAEAMPGIIAKIITMVAIAVWNYIIMNRLIFRRQVHN